MFRRKLKIETGEIVPELRKPPRSDHRYDSHRAVAKQFLVLLVDYGKR